MLMVVGTKAEVVFVGAEAYWSQVPGETENEIFNSISISNRFLTYLLQPANTKLNVKNYEYVKSHQANNFQSIRGKFPKLFVPKKSNSILTKIIIIVNNLRLLYWSRFGTNSSISEVTQEFILFSFSSKAKICTFALIAFFHQENLLVITLQ